VGTCPHGHMAFIKIVHEVPCGRTAKHIKEVDASFVVQPRGS